MRLPANAPFDRLDSGEALFVERALTWVETELYNTLFPPLEGRKYVPTDNQYHPGSKTTAYRQYTRTGIAKLVSERGHDYPTSGLFVREFFHQFYLLGSSYEYTYDDLLAAQMNQVNGGPPLNLDLEKSIACREQIEKALDTAAAIGSAAPGTIGSSGMNAIGPDVGLLGLLNQPNASVYTVLPGMSSSQLWAQKTPDEIVRDFTGAYQSQVTTTFKIHKPTAVLMPIAQYELIAGIRMGDGSDETILSFLMKVYQGRIKSIDSWQMCQGAGSGGTDRLVFYDPDKRNLKHAISQEFTQMPVQYVGTEYKVLCRAKTAGVICPRPLSVTYADGV